MFSFQFRSWLDLDKMKNVILREKKWRKIYSWGLKLPTKTGNLLANYVLIHSYLQRLVGVA